MSNLSRRQFVKRAVTGSTVLSAGLLLAKSTSADRNDQIHAAVIGANGRGRYLLGELLKRPEVQVSALCDVDEAVVERAAELCQSRTGKKPARHRDFRRVLDDPALHAVFIATPHHWHSPIAVPALLAGKDVYVEKPASHVFREGRLLVEAARRHHRLVQHGTQMRSSEVTRKAGEILASGLLGEIKMTKAWNVQRHTHKQPAADAPLPAGVDYDLWLGPAPQRPFNPNRFHGNWQWYRDYGNGDIGNDGVHDLDMARWGLGVQTHPVQITAHGSRIDLQGEREYPDNMMVAFQYADNKVLIYEDRGWTPYGMHGFDSGNAFYGTKGYMIFSRRGYFQVYLGQGEEKGPSMRGGAGIPEHLNEFLDCIRSRRQPAASAEIAHLTCALVHLGEIAYRTGRVLRFNPEKEIFLNDPEANTLLTKEYRKPWGLPESL